VRFAGEMIGGGGEAAIGALAQRGAYRVKFDVLVRDGVWSSDSRGAGIVIVEFPGSECAVGRYAAFDFDYAGWTEIGPGELLFARPDNFHGLACGSREPCGFEGRIGRVFTAIGRAGIGHDHADVFFGEMEGFGEIVARGERALRSGPHGELCHLSTRRRRRAVRAVRARCTRWCRWNRGDGLSAPTALFY